MYGSARRERFRWRDSVDHDRFVLPVRTRQAASGVSGN
jgi:hypothetical protein